MLAFISMYKTYFQKKKKKNPMMNSDTKEDNSKYCAHFSALLDGENNISF